MSESASATIAATEINPTTWQYSITLTDTGTTPIGTFWFAWVPGKDFLTTNPISVTDPTGWTDNVTHGGASDGYAIQFLAPGSTPLAAGDSLSGFSFTTTDAPSSVFGNSTFYPTTPTLTSFVYHASPFSDAGFQFTVTACLCAGTLIRTTRGDVPVEELAPSDHVLTDDTASRPVMWIGHRRTNCRRHPSPAQVWPVRVMRDAFAPGQPRRDLLLSPDHAVFVDGVLIPVKHLVNGTTVAQAKVDEVVYYHVELDRHDVMLANDLPVESYLDTGDRSAFENGGRITALYPEFALRVREAEGHAPLVVAGDAVAEIRRRLNARADRVLQHAAA